MCVVLVREANFPINNILVNDMIGFGFCELLLIRERENVVDSLAFFTTSQ